MFAHDRGAGAVRGLQATAPGKPPDQETRAMPEMIAIVYPNKDTAFQVRERLLQLQSEYLIEIADAVVVTKDAGDKVELHQAVNLTAAGAVSGGFWGSLIGLLFLNPLLGLAVGAAAGALSGRFTDYGIPDGQMRELAANFTPGTAALFVLVRKFTADKVSAEMARFGGTVLRTSLSQDEERKLREALHAQVPPVAPAPTSAPT
jgi:uncharacterized membrane protein